MGRIRVTLFNRRVEGLFPLRFICVAQISDTQLVLKLSSHLIFIRATALRKIAQYKMRMMNRLKLMGSCMILTSNLRSIMNWWLVLRNSRTCTIGFPTESTFPLLTKRRLFSNYSPVEDSPSIALLTPHEWPFYLRFSKVWIISNLFVMVKTLSLVQKLPSIGFGTKCSKIRRNTKLVSRYSLQNQDLMLSTRNWTSQKCMITRMSQIFKVSSSFRFQSWLKTCPCRYRSRSPWYLWPSLRQCSNPSLCTSLSSPAVQLSLVKNGPSLKWTNLRKMKRETWFKANHRKL